MECGGIHEGPIPRVPLGPINFFVNLSCKNAISNLRIKVLVRLKGLLGQIGFQIFYQFEISALLEKFPSHKTGDSPDKGSTLYFHNQALYAM